MEIDAATHMQLLRAQASAASRGWMRFHAAAALFAQLVLERQWKAATTDDHLDTTELDYAAAVAVDGADRLIAALERMPQPGPSAQRGA